jgi:hypothetical protein
MHRVGSAGNTNSSSRPRKEKRLTYVLNDADDRKVNYLFFFKKLPALIFSFFFFTFGLKRHLHSFVSGH